MSSGSRALASAVCALLLFAAGGCGHSAGPRNPLAWTTAPQVYAPRDLPQDRIVVGHVRNRSRTATVRLQATALRVLDAQDHLVSSSAGFTASYAHGLFGAFQQPSALPTRELVRLGRIAILDPDASSPLFVALRLPQGVHEPLRIDYGSGTLAVPTGARPAAR